MSVMKCIIIGGAAELEDFTFCEGDLAIRVDTEANGFVRIGSSTVAFKDGRCVFPRSRLKEGRLTPRLILPNATLTLPEVMLTEGGVALAPLGDSYVRGLSLRQSRTEGAIRILTEKIAELDRAVHGKIF